MSLHISFSAEFPVQWILMFEPVTHLGTPLSCLEISGLFQMGISLHGISEENNKQIPPRCQGGVHGKVFKVIMLSSNKRQISVFKIIHNGLFFHNNNEMFECLLGMCEK